LSIVLFLGPFPQLLIPPLVLFAGEILMPGGVAGETPYHSTCTVNLVGICTGPVFPNADILIEVGNMVTAWTRLTFRIAVILGKKLQKLLVQVAAQMMKYLFPTYAGTTSWVGATDA
jgi:hypothetical protein